MTTEQKQSESDDRFEERLRSFRPITPKPLGIRAQNRVPWRFLAYACALLVIIAGVIHVSDIGRPRGLPRATDEDTKTTNISGSVTVGRLNEALRASDRDFDQFLSDSGRDLLPHERQGTALYVLSKE